MIMIMNARYYEFESKYNLKKIEISSQLTNDFSILMEPNKTCVL